ncbi:S8 family serine peptidase [Inquilinus limosus]|uniref:S8 family serine peptidase n=1 Tax=Inquilinus limosus TaxID=171674 RepID=UPI003F180D64
MPSAVITHSHSKEMIMSISMERISDLEGAKPARDETATSFAAPEDPLYAKQWHLTGEWGLNLDGIWQDYTGAGVVVAVRDSGVAFAHKDLDGNVDRSRSVDIQSDGKAVLGGDADPFVLLFAPAAAHGTSVAGIIAAERNDIGGVGIAYGAKLISINNSGGFTREEQVRDHVREHADIVNNSWGTTNFLLFRSERENAGFIDNFDTHEYAGVKRATERAAAEGRDGLGSIIVQSAGNSGQVGDDTNLHSFQNNRFTIAVAASDKDGSICDYSSPGATVLVAAPGSQGTIVTTDHPGWSGFDSGDYTETFNGTSAAAPMVSGVVALMLQANPGLGWRDVQKILAYSARSTSDAAASDQTNGADDWNGGGLTFNRHSGFGLVDAHAAVRLAETWGAIAQTSANEASILSAARTPGKAIPDNGGSVTDEIVITDHVNLEHVAVYVDIDHTQIGDVQICLISPDGTESVLLDRPGRFTQELNLPDKPALGGGKRTPTTDPNGLDQDDIKATLHSVQHWGEDSAGTWKLVVKDLNGNHVGTLNSWKLMLYGADASENDTYVYTNEFGRLTGDAGRGTLSDMAGIDTINTAAVTTDSIIDLSGATASNIAGRALSFAAGTSIENAIGGDGADRLIGSAVNNILTGARGADTLTGNAGADRFVYQRCADSIGTGRDLITDFDHGQGDRIDLSLIDAESGLADDQAFRFLGTAGFDGRAGALACAAENGNTLIQGDIDGDHLSDISIIVKGFINLVAEDFIL